MKILAALISSIFLIPATIANPTSDYQKQVSFDLAGNFQLFWKNDDETVTFQLHALTKGWAALGFSPSGAMTGADIALFWVDRTGKGFVSDRHATQNGFPPEDVQQDYKLEDAKRNDTHLIVTFSRKKETCDPEDYALTDDTIRVIYASNDIIPESKDSFSKHTVRGSKSLYLFNKKLDTETPSGVPPEKGAVSLELRVNKVSVPENMDTIYWCEVLRMEKMKNKMHIIKIEPVIQPENVAHVHHMIIYVCNKNMTKYLGHGQNCFDENDEELPAFERCQEQVLAAWAVGAQSISYPDDVGMPFFNEEGDMFVMMEVHYDNSQFKKGIVDSSGMRVWMTEKMRKYDADQAMLGIPVGADEQVIPPGMKEFTNYGYCNSKCTDGFPKDGVKIMGALLHTHLAGRKVRLLHIRDGKQLPNIISDEHYDFNYQDYRRFNEPITLLPKDDLVVECVYETLTRDKTTFSGRPTRSEMCEVYIDYYPGVYNGFFCQSSPNKKELYGKIGINVVDMKSQSSPFGVRLPNGTIKSLPRYLKEDHKFDWTPTKSAMFQDAVRDVKHDIICLRGEGDNDAVEEFFVQDGFPVIKEPLKPKESSCGKNGTGTNAGSDDLNRNALLNKAQLRERNSAGSFYKKAVLEMILSCCVAKLFVN